MSETANIICKCRRIFFNRASRFSDSALAARLIGRTCPRRAGREQRAVVLWLYSTDGGFKFKPGRAGMPARPVRPRPERSQASPKMSPCRLSTGAREMAQVVEPHADPEEARQGAGRVAEGGGQQEQAPPLTRPAPPRQAANHAANGAVAAAVNKSDHVFLTRGLSVALGGKAARRHYGLAGLRPSH